MPTTPSPYGYNTYRYRKVSNRAKKSSGGLCGVIVLGAIVVTTAIVAAPVVYFV